MQVCYGAVLRKMKCVQKINYSICLHFDLIPDILGILNTRK